MSNPAFKGHPHIEKIVMRVVMIAVTWSTIVACALLTVFVLGAWFAPADSKYEVTYTTVYGNGANELLSIPVNGTIVGSESEISGFGFLDGELYVAGYTIKDQLYDAAEDDMVNGVVLEFNSPGGTIYGSRAIADGITYYKEKTDKPVYAFVSGTAASGAYWAAAAADKIYADHGSDIGSIGVVMGPFQYYNKPLAEDGGLLTGGVITQNGIESTTITAGVSKDIGNPYRKLTDQEVASLQKTVNNEYDTFVQFVGEQRRIDQDVLRNTIGAMVYDTKTAKELKLTDETTNRQDAYEALAKAAGIEDDFYVVQEEKVPGVVESLISSVTKKPQPQASQTSATGGSACVLTRKALVYHGDVAAFCPKK